MPRFREHPGALLLDQSLLNLVLRGDWAELAPAWNWQYTRASMLFEGIEEVHISLVAANLTRNSRSRMDAAAEERYYRTSTLPRPRLGTLVSLASAAGVFLLLTGVAQV